MKLPEERLERAKKVERAIASAFRGFGFYRVRMTFNTCRWDLEMQHRDFLAFLEAKERRDDLEQKIIDEGFYLEVDKAEALAAKAASHASGGKLAMALYCCLLKGKVWTFKIAQGNKPLWHHWKKRWRWMDGEWKRVYLVPMTEQTHEFPVFTLTEEEIERCDDLNWINSRGVSEIG